MESAVADEYTVVINGKPTGPYPLEALKTMDIQHGTFVRKPGMSDYKEAHEFAELRELLGLKYRKTAPQYFASFDQRLLASVIDFFFIAIGYAVLVLISFVFIQEKAQRISVIIIGLPIIPLVKFIYSSIAEASAKQGTAGKALMNIRVTDLSGDRISIENSFGRNIAKILSVLPVFFGYLYSFLNKRQQCFHDVIADTLVVKDRLI